MIQVELLQIKDMASQKHIVAQIPQTYLISKRIPIRQDSFPNNLHLMVYKCTNQMLRVRTSKLGFNQCVKIDLLLSPYQRRVWAKFLVFCQITSLTTSISCYNC